MKLTIITGHRGTGKTHFLHLLQQVYKKQALYFDLDREIEKALGKSISELFDQKGEAHFRQWERRVFNQIVESIPKAKTAFLAVGAGFVFEKNPSWHVIHLSRASDSLGRIFLDHQRPPLCQSPSLIKNDKTPNNFRPLCHNKQGIPVDEHKDKTPNGFRLSSPLPCSSKNLRLKKDGKGEHKTTTTNIPQHSQPKSPIPSLPHQTAQLTTNISQHSQSKSPIPSLPHKTVQTTTNIPQHSQPKSPIPSLPHKTAQTTTNIPQHSQPKSPYHENLYLNKKGGGKSVGGSARAMTHHESLYLNKQRARFYKKISDEELFRPEGWTELKPSDLLFLGKKKLNSPLFSLRLNPEDLPQEQDKLNEFLQRRLNCWGIRFFELSDQSAHPAFIQKVKELIPIDKLLFSSQGSKKFAALKGKKNFSWDLSLGPPPQTANILSLHHREGKSLKELLKSFSSYKSCHLKLAVEIFHLQELKIAYEWQKEDPKNRSFLPRSKDGRWLWFRQAFGPEMFLHFIRERTELPTTEASLKGLDEGKKQTLIPAQATLFEAPDQPFLSQALPFVKKRKALAGILGHPVSASATPAEQEDFFNRQRGIPFVCVPLTEEEMNKESLNLFQSLGFVFFAVTSPLKEKAFLAAHSSGDKISKTLKRSNSLVWHKACWKSFNTDWEGVKQLKKFSSPETAVWGGGGMRPALKKALPLARFYSARKGSLLPSLSEKDSSKEDSPNPLLDEGSLKPLAEEGSLNPLSEEGSLKPLSEEGSLNHLPEEGSPKPLSEEGSPNPLSEEVQPNFKMQAGMSKPLLSLSESSKQKRLEEEEFSPKTLIWAVGRQRMEDCKWPPRHWRISQVIDLNYTEDSPGREYALQTAAKYQSGWRFFKTQAKKQREIFKNLFPIKRGPF